MSQEFEVVVIGGGPGGYIAAIRAAQLGFKTVCIDAGVNKDNTGPALGGSCLNVGCIPSKALLQSSENFHELSHSFKEHGINAEKVSFDAKKMIARKDAIVTKLTGGIAFLFKKNKIESIFGKASIAALENNLWKIEVQREKDKISLLAKNVIIATGSVPRPLPIAPVDNINILDNVGTLNLTEVPKRLGMIGSGIIGVELGSVWNRLGSKVTILEALDTFLPMADQQIAKEAYKIFTKEQNLNIILGTKVSEVENAKNSVKVTYEINGKKETVEFDKLIVAIGRVPNTEGLNAQNIGLEITDRGFIKVDNECRTNLANIWAIGDVVRGPMLAHKAMEEGVAVAERLAGQKSEVNLDIMPSVIYTNPEIAWVGKTEEDLKKDGIKYKKGSSSFAANGRALGLGNSTGSIKILADEKLIEILGVHMIGPMVSELLSEAVLGLEFYASSEDIARTIHAHPTLSEVFHEASLAVDKRALHG